MADTNEAPPSSIRRDGRQREHNPHGPSVRTYLIIFGLLILLLVATVAAAYLPLGAFSTPLALMIATAKGALIILFFMHVKDASRLTWVFAGASFVWLGIMGLLTFTDYSSRNVLPRAQAHTLIRDVDSAARAPRVAR